ncbi:carboxypeptidase-like regulatory domain-containing protein [Phytobacter sp. V91]|uniref:carboxypeptidase-like regulatory domain-containing protein n=1 Tax=Phytobacter sp. V91 TaxID=3369425 RepID=UPI003F60B48C
MMKRFWPGIILLVLLQSGCVAYTQSQPRVEGQLLDSAGNAVTGADITLKSNAPDASTITDSNGFFAFPGDHEWSFFLPIGPIDKLNRSQLLIDAQGQHYDILLSSGLSGPYGSGPSEMGVVCRLPSSQLLTQKGGITPDICQQRPFKKMH